MSFRMWINQHAGTASAIAVLLLVVALAVTLMFGRPERLGMPDRYFYDLNTGELFMVSTDALPPIETSSGPFQGRPAGVQAHVYACGECEPNLTGATMDDLRDSETYIAWFERYSDEVIEMLPRRERDLQRLSDDRRHQAYEMMDEGLLVSPDARQWLRGNDEAGMQLIEDAVRRCEDGSYAEPCHP